MTHLDWRLRDCAIAFGIVAGRESSPSVSALRATINYRKEAGNG